MKNSWLFALVAALVLVAGCSAPSGPAAGAPAPGSTPGETPAGSPGAMAEGAISFVSVPSEVMIGKAIDVTWHVDGSVDSTELRYGTKSKADVAEPTTTTYPSKKEGSGSSGDYSASLQFDEPITVYVRAHAVVDGKDVWTEEKAVKIVTKMASTGMVADETADDGY